MEYVLRTQLSSSGGLSRTMGTGPAPRQGWMKRGLVGLSFDGNIDSLPSRQFYDESARLVWPG